MCEQCSAKTKTYGEVAPHWWLVQATIEGNIMKKGDFGLVWANDPDFIWPESLHPRKDPSFEYTDEEFDNMTEEKAEAWDQFQEYIDQLEPYLQCDPATGHNLFEAALKAGYSHKKHGYFTGWLSHRMAVVIARNPDAKESVVEKFAAEEYKAWEYTPHAPEIRN